MIEPALDFLRNYPVRRVLTAKVEHCLHSCYSHGDYSALSVSFRPAHNILPKNMRRCV